MRLYTVLIVLFIRIDISLHAAQLMGEKDSKHVASVKRLEKRVRGFSPSLPWRRFRKIETISTRTAAFLPSGWLVTGGYDNCISAFNTDTGKLASTISFNFFDTDIPLLEPLSDTHVAVAGSCKKDKIREGLVGICDVRFKKRWIYVSSEAPWGEVSALSSIQSDVLVLGTQSEVDGQRKPTILLFDPSRESVINRFPYSEPEAVVSALKGMPKQNKFVSGSNSKEGRVQIWDICGKNSLILGNHGEVIRNLIYLDETSVVSVGSRLITVWDIRQNKEKLIQRQVSMPISKIAGISSTTMVMSTLQRLFFVTIKGGSLVLEGRGVDMQQEINAMDYFPECNHLALSCYDQQNNNKIVMMGQYAPLKPEWLQFPVTLEDWSSVREDQIQFYMDKFRESPESMPDNPNFLQRRAFLRVCGELLKRQDRMLRMR